MRRIKTITTKVVLASSLAFSFVTTPPAIIVGTSAILITQTACPSQKDLDRMAKASGELAYDAGLVTDVVTEAYTAKKISFEKKNQYADALLRISKAGKKFNNLLIELDKKHPEGTVPPETAQFLRDNFREVAEPFRELLGGLNLFGLGGDKDVKELKKDVETIEEVLNK